MSKRALSWLLIISLVINISTLGTFSYYRWLKPEKNNRKENINRHRKSLQEKLGLSDEQSAKMDSSGKKFFREIRPLIDEVRANRTNVIEMIKYVHSKDYQIGLHATGDRAIDAAVDGFVMACEEKPGGDPRHYIIHGDFISRKKAEALAKQQVGKKRLYS